MNGLEALLRVEREHGRQDPTVSWYVKGWLVGEDPDESGHAFETGQGLAPNGVVPYRFLRLRMSGRTAKDPDPSMLNETRTEVRRAGPMRSSGWDASAKVFKALRRAKRRPEGTGVAPRSALHHGRKGTPC
jgi:hypothetical protein